jgi:hypothetical protein
VLAAANGLADATAARALSQAQLDSLVAQVAPLQGQIRDLNGQIDTAQGALRDANARITDLDPRVEEFRLARETATARLLGSVPTDVPLVLLPLRPETRFAAGTNGPELWLRVYLDILAVDTHEPGLTEVEELWGSGDDTGRS